MRTLAVERNQLDYLGLYARPPFKLWGAGEKILEGMYDAFEGFHTGLSDFRVEGEGGSPADQAVVLTLPQQLVFRFKFDRIAASLYDFAASDRAVFSEVVDRGRGWLDAEAGEVPFRSHLITYAAHASLSEGTAEELLRSLDSPRLDALGEDLGTGLLFHASMPGTGWRVQMMLDHSLSVAGGLYLQFALLATGDRIDCHDALDRGFSMFGDALREIGLAMEEVTG